MINPLQDCRSSTFCRHQKSSFHQWTSRNPGPRQLHISHLYDQKNAVRGEQIGHGLSGNPSACAIRRVLSRIRYLHGIGNPPTTPICTVRLGRRWRSVRSTDLTTALHDTFTNVRDSLGVSATNILEQYLWAGGSMSLLLGNIDTNTIQLVGQ